MISTFSPSCPVKSFPQTFKSASICPPSQHYVNELRAYNTSPIMHNTIKYSSAKTNIVCCMQTGTLVSQLHKHMILCLDNILTNYSQTGNRNIWKNTYLHSNTSLCQNGHLYDITHFPCMDKEIY